MVIGYLLYSNTAHTQVTGGGSTGLGGFSQGVSVGARNSNPFTPGGVNNPSGKSGTGKDRFIFWVHGLNGDIDSWSRAANASQNNVAPGFPARKIKSRSNFTYTQSASLLEAGQQVSSEIDSERQNSEDPTKNYVIAHSQGGMVTRGLLHMELCLNNTDPKDMAFGGLVTFCSPHQGAQLLNGKRLFGVLASEMCEALTAGPVFEFGKDADKKIELFGFQHVFKIHPFIDKFVKVGVTALCNTFTDAIVPYVTNAQTPNITKDYEVGAKLLKEMNDCLDGNTNLEKFPKVAFYGVEPKNHLMLRTVQYFQKSCNNYSYFAANDDNELIDLFQDNYNKYITKHEEWTNRLNELNSEYHSNKCYTFIRYYIKPCPDLRNRRGIAENLVTGYLKGVQFLESMDDKYKLIIGALKIIQEKKYFCECEDFKTGEFTRTEIDDPSKCDVGKKGYTICDVAVDDVYRREEYDSDGVVLASSASSLPGATFKPQLLKNTSHMQARNNEALQYGLYLLYEGGTDPFFKTDRK